MVGSSSEFVFGNHRLFPFEKEPNSTELLASYLQAYPNTLLQVERTSSDSEILQQAFQAYDKEDFEVAHSLFDRYLEENFNNNVLFYKANALLALGRIQEALPLFQQLSNDNNSIYHSQSEWYLALCLMKANQPEKANELLEKIASFDSHEFRESASKLLSY